MTSLTSADGGCVMRPDVARPLHTAFDQLAGRGRWVPRDGLGTFPIRFPVPEPPGDDGWHIESTGGGVDGKPIVDPLSRERVLLLLFLFSDVGPCGCATHSFCMQPSAIAAPE